MLLLRKYPELPIVRGLYMRAHTHQQHMLFPVACRLLLPVLSALCFVSVEEVSREPYEPGAHRIQRERMTIACNNYGTLDSIA